MNVVQNLINKINDKELKSLLLNDSDFILSFKNIFLNDKSLNKKNITLFHRLSNWRFLISNNDCEKNEINLLSPEGEFVKVKI